MSSDDFNSRAGAGVDATNQHLAVDKLVMAGRADQARFYLHDVGDGTRLTVLIAFCIALLSIAYWVLVAKHTSYTALYLNDVMALTAAAYRVFSGQIPSVDFYSPYGIAAFWPAALGFHNGLNAASVLAFGQVLVAALILVAAVLISYRRFSILQSLILVVFLFLLVAAPLRMGGSPSDFTFGASYNRYGWAGVTVVLLLYVEPRRTRLWDTWLDATVLALIVLYLFFNKVNFAAVALAFLLANMTVSAYNRKVSLLSLGTIMSVIAVVEFLSGYVSAYVRDIGLMAGMTAAFPPGAGAVMRAARNSESALAACAVALVAVSLNDQRRWLNLGYFSATAAACLILATQSFAALSGLPALIAVLVCFCELSRRSEVFDGQRRILSSRCGRLRTPSWAILGLLVVFVAEPIAVGAFGLYDYARILADSPSPKLHRGVSIESGFLVEPAGSGGLHEFLGHDQKAHERLAGLRRAAGGAELDAPQYFSTIIEGQELLHLAAGTRQKLVVFDMTDPFSASLGLPTTDYGYPLFWIQNFSRTDYPSPDRFFSNADIVMVPILPYSQTQLDRMMETYGVYLEQEFELAQSSPHWHLWKRRSVGGNLKH